MPIFGGVDVPCIPSLPFFRPHVPLPCVSYLPIVRPLLLPCAPCVPLLKPLYHTSSVFTFCTSSATNILYLFRVDLLYLSCNHYTVPLSCVPTVLFLRPIYCTSSVCTFFIPLVRPLYCTSSVCTFRTSFGTTILYLLRVYFMYLLCNHYTETLPCVPSLPLLRPLHCTSFVCTLCTSYATTSGIEMERPIGCICDNNGE